MYATSSRALVSRLIPAFLAAALTLTLSGPPGFAAGPAASPAKPAPALNPDAPVTVSHSGDQEGWHYTTKATVGKDRLDLEETAHRQDAGGMDIEVHATGHLENFRPSAGLEFKDGRITRFGYVYKNAHGTIDFSWTARKDDKGVGSLDASAQVLKLPPLAELPLDIGGFPFTLDIGSGMLIKPAFTGAGESTHGHFTVQSQGDLGISVENGKATPVGSLQVDGQIAGDTSSTATAPMGFIGAVALPKLELRPGFLPSSLSSANGGLAQRAHQLLEQNGMMAGPGPGLGDGGASGSYVELITSGGLADSGPLVLLPCQQTLLFLFLKVGDAGAGVSEGRSFQLKTHHRIFPATQGCAQGLGDGGGVQKPPSASLPPCDAGAAGTDADFLGVSGGKILRPFGGAHGHLGADVGKLRDAPVFANLRATIPMAELNRVRSVKGVTLEGVPCAEGVQCLKDTVDVTGLGIAGQGDAKLVDAEVLVQKWSPSKTTVDASYGGVLGLAAHYQYVDNNGKQQVFTAYVEYEHLITGDYPPRRDNGDFSDDENQKIDSGTYSGCKGFGAKMTNGAVLTAAELAQHPLIGDLGATQTPHVHIQAAFSPGKVGYVRQRFFDPAVLLAGR